ncbi:MAG: hypothetical protein IPG22_06460 [Acidobacteria bacterium]|jgi:hypothetical protein|nr:hypothetical protein [Acidobacteriota bacterium]
MAITLTYGSTVLDLPDDLLWIDRHTWSPVTQSYAPSITGGAIIDTGEKTAGRPITLAGDESHAWLTYEVVSQLKVWAAIPDCQMSLSIQGAAYPVIFRHYEPPALDLTPVVDYAAPDAADFFYGQLKFMGTN